MSVVIEREEVYSHHDENEQDQHFGCAMNSSSLHLLSECVYECSDEYDVGARHRVLNLIHRRHCVLAMLIKRGALVKCFPMVDDYHNYCSGVKQNTTHDMNGPISELPTTIQGLLSTPGEAVSIPVFWRIWIGDLHWWR